MSIGPNLIHSLDAAHLRGLPELKSQRQIDLEESWWKERITFYEAYLWNPWMLNYDSFYTTLDGYWWKHHQLSLGPLVIEWKTRRSKMLTHQ